MKSNLFQSPLFNVLVFAFFWAIQIFVSKLGYASGAKIVPFAIQSFIVTLLVLAIYVLPRRYKEIKSLSPNTISALLVANGIHMGIGGFLSYAGIALTSAINAGILVQFGTVTTTFLAWLLLKEKFTLAKSISILAIFIGVFLLVTKGRLISPHIGDILILAACLAWSLGNVLVRKILKYTKVSPDVVSFFRPVAGLPLLLVFVLLSPLYPLSVRQMFSVNYFDFHQAFFMVLSGLFTALYFIYLNKTLQIASASYMTMMSAITPVLVSLMAIIFLKEKLVLIQAVGIFLIVSQGILTHYLKTDKH